jgi:hypothetical protein
MSGVDACAGRSGLAVASSGMQHGRMTRGGGGPGWPTRARVAAALAATLVGIGVVVLVGRLRPGLGWTRARWWLLLLALVVVLLAWRIARRRLWRPRSRTPRRRRARDRAREVALLVAAGMMLLLGLADLGPSWRAAHGGGYPGTLILAPRACSEHCPRRGTFASDDGTVRRYDVVMYDGVPAGAPAGTRIRVRDTGALGGVFAERGSTTWHLDAFLTVFGLLVLVPYLLLALVPAAAGRDTAPEGRPVPSGVTATPGRAAGLHQHLAGGPDAPLHP